MEKRQSNNSIGLVVVVVTIIILIFGCFAFFCIEDENPKQRAGEIYIIGDEIVNMGYIGSGEGL